MHDFEHYLRRLLAEHEPFEGFEQIKTVLRRLADELGPEPRTFDRAMIDALTPFAKTMPSENLAHLLRIYADRLQAESA